MVRGLLICYTLLLTPAWAKPPVVPAQPAAPATPAIPATPAQPAAPGSPATPATPAQPATPASPATPAQSAVPPTPSKPVQSATPASPATPGTPASHATPATPASVLAPRTTEHKKEETRREPERKPEKAPKPGGGGGLGLPLGLPSIPAPPAGAAAVVPAPAAPAGSPPSVGAAAAVVAPLLIPAATSQKGESQPFEEGATTQEPKAAAPVPMPAASVTTGWILASIPFTLSGAGMGDEALATRLAGEVAKGVVLAMGWRSRLTPETTGLAVPTGPPWTPAKTRAVGAQLGVQRLLTGEIIRATGHATVRAAVRDAETGQPVATAASLMEQGRGEEAVRDRLVERLLGELVEKEEKR